MEIHLEYSLKVLILKVKLQYLAAWCEQLNHWKRPWCWAIVKAGGEGDDRCLDGWMESPTQWTWVWPSPRSWWWTGMLGVLQSMGLQKVGHYWATDLKKKKKKWTACQVVSQIQVLLTCPSFLRDMCLFPQLVCEHFELKAKPEAHTASWW